MRSCGEYELLISAFLDGELSGDERVELAEHLTACPKCQRYFDDLVAMHDAIEQAEEAPVPEGFAAGVMARVRETPQSGKVIRFPRWKRWTALAACCAVAALGLWTARQWTPRTASQTAMAESAMIRSAPPADAGDGAEDGGLMLMMDEGPDGDVPDIPMKAALREAEDSSPADGAASDAAVRESAAEKNGEADACMEAAAPMPALAGGTTLCGAVTAGGPAARAWVETVLGLAWERGRIYPLTEEEYAGLLDALSAAGEEFRLEAGEECRLLAAEPDGDGQ